jgi:hypothetical protein
MFLKADQMRSEAPKEVRKFMFIWTSPRDFRVTPRQENSCFGFVPHRCRPERGAKVQFPSHRLKKSFLYG